MSRRAKQLVLSALDQWDEICYYHKLIEINVDKDSLECLHLYHRCYLKLVEQPHHELDKTLRDLKKELGNSRVNV